MTNQIKAFSKESYHKSEILPELLSYQQEIAVIAMGEENKDVRFFELIKYFESENEQLGGALTTSLEKFRKDSLMIANLIKAEISGCVGETKAFQSLEKLRCNNRIIKNIELCNDTFRTEIDAVVVTEKGIFIIEVKNTQKNVFIDKNGDFYRNSKYQKFDSNISSKMQIKETLLREKLDALGYGGIKIFPVIVFTNKYIEVQNKRRGLKTCFLNQLPYVIDDWKSFEDLTTDDLEAIEKELTDVAASATFPMHFDTNSVKANFIELMNHWECEKNQTQKIKSIKNKSDFLNSKICKYAGVAAVAIVIGSLSLLRKQLYPIC